MDDKPSFRLWSFLFSPFGRTSRRGYWAFAVPVSIALYALYWVINNVPPPVPLNSLSNPAWLYLMVAGSYLAYVFQWLLFAISARRLHDVNWSAVFALPFLVYFLPGLPSLVLNLLHADDSLRTMVASVEMLLHFPLWLYCHLLVLFLALVPGSGSANRYDLTFSDEPAAA